MRRFSRGGILLASIPLIIGIAALYGAWASHRTAAASRGWSSVEGEIIEAFVLVSDSRTDRRRITTYTPQWRYRYDVGGRAYTSDRIQAAQAGQGFRTEKEALEAASARYPIGTAVQVFYDPAEASSAVLYPGEVSQEGMALLLSSGILLVGFSFVLLFGVKGGPRLPRLAVCASCQCEYPAERRARAPLCPACTGAA